MAGGVPIFTTSRYASGESRALARKLAEDSGEKYVARGKKTVAQLAEAARRLGDGRISIVEERRGKAALIASVIVDERGRWSWAEERLLNPTEKRDNG